MPCDSVVYNSIELEQAVGHEGILAEAMRAAGYTVQESGKSLSFYRKGINGSYSRGKFRVESGSGFDVDEVKKHFGQTVVKVAAKKFGWTVKQQPNGKIKLTKRS